MATEETLRDLTQHLTIAVQIFRDSLPEVKDNARALARIDNQLTNLTNLFQNIEQRFGLHLNAYGQLDKDVVLLKEHDRMYHTFITQHAIDQKEQADDAKAFRRTVYFAMGSGLVSGAKLLYDLVIFTGVHKP